MFVILVNVEDLSHQQWPTENPGEMGNIKSFEILVFGSAFFPNTTVNITQIGKA